MTGRKWEAARIALIKAFAVKYLPKKLKGGGEGGKGGEGGC